MSQKHILNLLNQFHKAVGISNTDYKFLKDISGFSEWIFEHKKVLLEYKTFLESLDINIDYEQTYEVGKGKYDSIILDKFYVISEYASTLGISDSYIYVMGVTPLLVSETQITKMKKGITLITHNPYDNSCIKDWNKIHEYGIDIVVGACGKKQDADKAEKIDMIKKSFETIYDDVKVNYEENNGNYFFTINSKRKTLERVLTR